MLYVAVVCREGRRARNKEGHWASFIGYSKEEVIQKAIAARAQWHEDMNKRLEHYQIFVGTLNEEVVPPPPRPENYDLRSL